MNDRLHLALCLIGLAPAACMLNSDGEGMTPIMVGTTTGAGTTSSSGDASDGPIDSSGGGPFTEGPRKRRIDIAAAFTTEELGGATLLVMLDSTRIEYEDTAPGGADLRFFGSEDEPPYPIEIERWDPEGRSFVWVYVNAPALPDHLWMYYGDEESFAPMETSEVWDDDFAAVWHMARSEGMVLRDATAAGNDLSPIDFGGTFDEVGHIGLGALIAPPGMPSEVGPLHLPSPNTLELHDGFTMEAWVSPTVAMDTNMNSILRKGNAYNLWVREPNSTIPAVFVRTQNPDEPHRLEAGASAPMNQWTYVAATYSAQTGQIAIYRNGKVEGLDLIDGEPMGRMLIDAEQTAQVGHNLNARLDEVRVSTIARSGAWIELQYASMSDELMTFWPPQSRD